MRAYCGSAHAVPSMQTVTLKVSLYYESDVRVEDKEQSILVLCKSEYSAYTLTPAKLEETIDFRIEKVSRRKDGQRFKVCVEPDYSQAKPKGVVLQAVLSDPINVMSKRKTGERIVSRRAPPRASLPGFPGLNLPLPNGIDLNSGSAPSAANLLSSSSLPFTLPPELSAAMPANNLSTGSGGGITDGADPVSIKLSFLSGQMGQIHELLTRVEKRQRISDKRLARLEARLGITGLTSMDGSGGPGMGPGASQSAVPLYPIPLSFAWSTDGGARNSVMLQGGSTVLSHTGQAASTVGQPGKALDGSALPREPSVVTGPPGPGPAQRGGRRRGAAGAAADGEAAASEGLPEQSGSAQQHSYTHGAGSGAMQFAVSLVDAGSKAGGTTASPAFGAHSQPPTMGTTSGPILLQASGSQGVLPPAFMRLSSQPAGMYPLGSGDASSGPPLQPSYSMSMPGIGGASSTGGGLGHTHSAGMPMNVMGLSNLFPGMSGFKRVRTTEMEVSYAEGDLMAIGSGLIGSSGSMPSGQGLSRSISDLVAPGAPTGTPDDSPGQHDSASRGASAAVGVGAQKRARIMVHEAEHNSGRSMVAASTTDPSLAALAASHAHSGR